MIIGISGKKQSGKNTVALIWQYLYDYYYSNYKYPITVEDFKEYVEDNHHLKSVWIQKSFAHKIKQITCILLGCTMEQLEDPIFKETPLGEEWWVIKLPSNGIIPYLGDYPPFYKKYDVIKLTPRMLMQMLGTEFGRDMIHPNIWCTSLFTDYYEDIEMWKDIVGYEGRYQISSFGRVKGLNREIVYGDKSKGEYHTKKESILKSTLTGKYEMIRLEGNNSVTIHSLVANAFLPKIDGKNYINHIDQNPLNNFYKNLEWCTQSENIVDANSKGNGNIGEKQYSAKLTDKDVEQIRILLKDRSYKQVDIAKKFKVCPTTISDIKHGRKWSHVGRNTCSLSPIVPQQPNWIITDVRFPNEARAIRVKGGILIKVNRDRIKILDNMYIHREEYNKLHNIIEHESETALDNYENWDYVINNNDSIEGLIEQVKQIMIKEGIIYE